jgi:uncharacterized protein
MPTKLQPDLPPSQFSITAHGPGYLTINGSRFTDSVLVTSDTPPQHWSCTNVSSLSAADLQAWRARAPELILLGTGRRQVMPSPRLMASLMQRGPEGEPPIGLEAMDTAAACRTFNLLAAEGRRVLAALIVEPASTDPN